MSSRPTWNDDVRRPIRIGWFAQALMLATICAAPACAQQIETLAPRENSTQPVPYLTPGTVNYRLFLAPPPVVGSVRDQTDVAIDLELQKDVDFKRFQVATDDSYYVYDRFADAFGKPLRRESLPLTIHLLNRAIRDVVDPIFKAKEAFQRPRPYQRYQLARVCGEEKPPKPETNPTMGSSYPSGHSAYGWTTALVLAEVAPERAGSLLQRAEDYAQSRLICGVHFASDVEAGRAIAVAVVESLQDVPAFRQDLACARAEYIGGRRPAPCPAT